jgi:hypothetical protein
MVEHVMTAANRDGLSFHCGRSFPQHLSQTWPLSRAQSAHPPLSIQRRASSAERKPFT